jgi:hypothetical protein
MSYEVHARHIHRQVEQKIPRAEEGFEHLPVIVLCQRPYPEVLAEGFGFAAPSPVVSGDDGDAFGASAQMAKDQGQASLCDAAEPQHDDPAREIDRPAIIGHSIFPDGAPVLRP